MLEQYACFFFSHRPVLQDGRRVLLNQLQQQQAWWWSWFNQAESFTDATYSLSTSKYRQTAVPSGPGSSSLDITAGSRWATSSSSSFILHLSSLSFVALGVQMVSRDSGIYVDANKQLRCMDWYMLFFRHDGVLVSRSSQATLYCRPDVVLYSSKRTFSSPSSAASSFYWRRISPRLPNVDPSCLAERR